MKVRWCRLGRLEVLWWGRWIGLASLGPFPVRDPGRGCVYAWRVAVGVLELRWWAAPGPERA